MSASYLLLVSLSGVVGGNGGLDFLIRSASTYSHVSLSCLCQPLCFQDVSLQVHHNVSLHIQPLFERNFKIANKLLENPEKFADYAELKYSKYCPKVKPSYSPFLGDKANKKPTAKLCSFSTRVVLISSNYYMKSGYN